MAYKDNKTKKWVANLATGELDANGKHKYKRKYNFKTKREAEDYEVRYNLEVIDTANNPFFKEVLALFYASKNGPTAESTFQKIIDECELRIMPYFSNKKINKIDHKEMLLYRDYLLNLGLSNNRVNYFTKKMKEIFNFYNNIADTDFNPFKQVKKLIEEPSKEIVFWTLKEFNQFIAHVNRIDYYTYFNLLYYTGVRKSEGLALTWDKVDLEKGTIYIKHSVIFKLKGIPWKLGPTKNKSSVRNIKINQFMINKLRELKEYYQTHLTNFDEKSFLFGVARPFAETTLDDNYSKFVKKAKVKRITFREFRHSHASLLINNGASILLVSKRLGHSDVKMTLNVYGHMYDDKEDEILVLIDALTAI